MAKNKRPYIYFPLLFAIVLIGGIIIGSRMNYSDDIISKAFKKHISGFTKLNEIIQYIEKEYVDSVNRDDLVNNSIRNLLQDLDPHSYYIPAEELNALNEPLEGNFEGIGIEFSIQKDTVVVVSPIVDGPSEQLGIIAGDRIVEVEGKNIAGIGIKNNEVIEMLRGQQGTKVKVGIHRRGKNNLLRFEITRDKIPIYSVDVAYMLNETTGFIKLSRFSKTTYQEFLDAGRELKAAGMKKLVLDLRGNGGGYLDAATKLADEFLANGKPIVYTEGRARPMERYTATSAGEFESTEVVVLINEGSASASEIIAGAIQDNDRGTIIGRRSFGKGLVQEQSAWPDGSALRLTTARYYTPTGRCIQKPYENGSKAYHLEYYDRYENGELQSADSIQLPDSLKFTTPGGKTVYGGGGIMPDVFVPIDTSGNSVYFSELSYRGLFRQFAFEYADRERDGLNSYKDFDQFNQSFTITESLLEEFAAFARNHGVPKDPEGLRISGDVIRMRIKANIARNIWNNRGYYPVINEQDNTVRMALELLNQPN